jgi:hypothetical protein
MTFDQAAALSILGAMIVLFVWNRLRYDLVALLGLVVAVGIGIVPPQKAFDGFRDQIVIIVASALVLSAAISRSSSSGAGSTVSRSLRAASAMPARAAQAQSDDTPGTTSTGKRPASRANRYMKEP